MLDRYEKAIIENLLDIIENENLKSAPAGRIIEFDGKFVFTLIAKLYGEEIELSWKDDKGEVSVQICGWKTRWAKVSDIFAMAMRVAVEGCM